MTLITIGRRLLLEKSYHEPLTMQLLLESRFKQRAVIDGMPTVFWKNDAKLWK